MHLAYLLTKLTVNIEHVHRPMQSSCCLNGLSLGLGIRLKISVFFPSTTDSVVKVVFEDPGIPSDTVR